MSGHAPAALALRNFSLPAAQNQRFALTISDGLVAQFGVDNALKMPESAPQVLNCQGALVLPSFVNLRADFLGSTAFEAIDDAALYLDEKLRATIKSGVAIVGLRLDTTRADYASLWEIAALLSHKYAHAISLVRVAAAPLATLAMMTEGGRIAAAVAREGGMLCCDVADDSGLKARLERVFALAASHELLLDLRLCEALTANAIALRTVAGLAPRFSMQGRVFVSAPRVSATDTLARCAEAGVILVADSSVRALVLQATRSAKVLLAYACDAPDLLADFLSVTADAGETSPIADWLDLITTVPRYALGAPEASPARVGANADLVIFSAHNDAGAMAQVTVPRIVIRAGTQISI